MRFELVIQFSVYTSKKVVARVEGALRVVKFKKGGHSILEIHDM